MKSIVHYTKNIKDRDFDGALHLHAWSPLPTERTLLSQLQITRKSDEVAQERYTVAQNRYLIGKIDITNLNIALTEKDDAKRSYINALRDYWDAYYNLRRLTLYDFVNNQLLYDAEDEPSN